MLSFMYSLFTAGGWPETLVTLPHFQWGPKSIKLPLRTCRILALEDETLTYAPALLISFSFSVSFFESALLITLATRSLYTCFICCRWFVSFSILFLLRKILLLPKLGHTYSRYTFSPHKGWFATVVCPPSTDFVSSPVSTSPIDTSFVFIAHWVRTPWALMLHLAVWTLPHFFVCTP